MTQYKIRSANMQEGIDYEVRRESINLQLSRKLASFRQMHPGKALTEQELKELRHLVASR
jgi:hypothetical protein